MSWEEGEKGQGESIGDPRVTLWKAKEGWRVREPVWHP